MNNSQSSQFHASARKKFLALSLESTRKSYYPQLQKQLDNLKRNEARLNLLIDNLPAYIAYVNDKEELVLVNRKFEKLMGKSRDEMIGQKLATITGKQNYTRVKAQITQVLSGETSRFEFYPETGQARGRCLEVNFIPEMENSGEISGFYIMTIDVTKNKEAEKEKLRLEASLHQAQKMEAIGTLSGGIAHDFNNILSGIFGYSQLIDLQISDPEKVGRHNRKIIEGARRATDLIQQILTFSRRTEFNKQPLHFSVILKEALKLLRSTIPTTIQIKEQIDSRAVVMADATQIHQVIMNLCTNAYHAMTDKGGILTVTLNEVMLTETQTHRQDQSGPFICLEIRDTGPGIAPEIRNKIFDPYFTTKDVEKGTGLGLAIVDGIVKKHEGFIELFTDPDEGTCFSIFFPVYKADEQKRYDSGAQELKSLPKGKGRIMLVDDEPGIRETFSGILTFQGYTVSAFEGGEPAFKAFAGDPAAYDLVITDMTMPEMTGLQLAKELLAIRKEIPVIICTGYHENFSKAEALQNGIARYLQKPVISSELLDNIQQLLNKG